MKPDQASLYELVNELKMEEEGSERLAMVAMVLSLPYHLISQVARLLGNPNDDYPSAHGSASYTATALAYSTLQAYANEVGVVEALDRLAGDPGFINATIIQVSEIVRVSRFYLQRIRDGKRQSRMLH